MNQVPRTYLQNLPNEVEAGVIIANIDPASAAGKAGLNVEDIITAINGTEVKNSTELRKFLYTNLSVGDKATFTIYRGAELKTIDVSLTSNVSTAN